MCKLDQNVFGANESWGKQEFIKELLYKDELSFLALQDNQLLGFIIASAYKSGGVFKAHINRIVVNQNFRCFGVGKKLIDFFEYRASELSIHFLTLEFDTKLGVDNFYRKLGYKQFTDKNEVNNYLKEKNKMSQKKLYLIFQRKIFYKKL